MHEPSVDIRALADDLYIEELSEDDPSQPSEQDRVKTSFDPDKNPDRLEPWLGPEPERPLEPPSFRRVGPVIIVRRVVLAERAANICIIVVEHDEPPTSPDRDQ